MPNNQHPSTVRTRFAPSPTGFAHVGSIRTALFAYLVARQAGGRFILRLEDTDKAREVLGSDQHLMASLRSLGLFYDEGPDVGGEFAPYRQSERLDIYRAWADKLIAAGRAYADPYSPEQIQEFRNQAKESKRAFLYRDHRPDNPPEWDGSQPLRFKSDPKAYSWQDEVMGSLSTGPEVVDDFILIKSDGYPTYNFAHIVDDAEMKISHVIRGQEFVSSMPNYLNLYEALGYDMTPATKHETGSASSSGPRHENGPALPVFATMPHIMAENGKKKLGKRDGAKDVLEYLDDGYLPEAMVNFIATLGWNDGTEQEIFTIEELVKKFSLDRVGRSGARFDEKRLIWINGQHIRSLAIDDLYTRVEPFWPEAAKGADEAYRRQVLSLVQDRLKTLKDLPALTSYFFEEPHPDWGMITSNKQLKKFTKDELVQLLQATREELAKLAKWNSDNIQVCLNELLETTEQKPGVLFGMIRIATTWADFSPQLNDTLALIGKEKTLDRIDRAINL